jgi:hypothetical protein
MNEGVQILLERMKTHPEDFHYESGSGMSRWSRLVDDAVAGEIATKEEEDALRKSLQEIRRVKFTEKVMKELMAPKEESDDLGKWFTQQASGTLSAGVRTSSTRNNTNTLQNNGYTLTAGGNGQPTWATTGTNSLSIGKETLTETNLHELLHMKAQLELERQKSKEAREVKHKTLFGKLFNYS